MMKIARLVTLFFCMSGLFTASAQAEPIRLGLLKFGTVKWEMDTIQRHRLMEKYGSELQIVDLAGVQASKVALQAGSADVIVADWVWVARQRNSGKKFAFIPYSSSVASLVVAPGSGIQSIADLKGKRLGVAGGPLDKTWLLLQALASSQGVDGLAKEVELVFGAPPLINAQIEAGRIDAAINYWHFVARLQAIGMSRLLSADDIVSKLGIESNPPLLGFVFDEAWGAAHGDELRALIDASRQAKTILCAEGSGEWEIIRPLTKASSDEVLNALRLGYCGGVPKQWNSAERASARKIFAVLGKLGGEKLVGSNPQLDEKIFWAGFDF